MSQSVLDSPALVTPETAVPGGQSPRNSRRIPLPGQRVAVFVPVHNSKGEYLRSETRTVIVLRIDDMALVPFSMHSVARTPHALRGRWRVKFYDRKRFKEAYAYLDRPGAVQLQLGVFDLETNLFSEPLSEAYPQDLDGLEMLAAICREMMRSKVARRCDSVGGGVFAVAGSEGAIAQGWSDDDVLSLCDETVLNA